MTHTNTSDLYFFFSGDVPNSQIFYWVHVCFGVQNNWDRGEGGTKFVRTQGLENRVTCTKKGSTLPRGGWGGGVGGGKQKPMAQG